MMGPYEFKALADYNTEVARGIAHTAEYDERMRAEQERFDQANRLQPCIVCGHAATHALVRGDQRATEAEITACDDCADLVRAVHT